MLVNDTYTNGTQNLLRAADGTLTSSQIPTGAPNFMVNFRNKVVAFAANKSVKLPLKTYKITSKGEWLNAGIIKGDRDLSDDVHPGQFVLFVSALSGALVCVKMAPLQLKNDSSSIEITNLDLLEPNNIGYFPRTGTTTTKIIPLDSPKIFVSFGLHENGSIITREQFWRRSADSFSISGTTKRTVGYFKKTGRDVTSTTQDTVAASLSLNARPCGRI
jgi:hypothetical protein